MSYWEFKQAARRAARLARARDEGLRKQKILDDQSAERKLDRAARRAVGNDLYLDIPEDIKLSKDYAENVWSKRYYNEVYSEYYAKLYEETNIPALRSVAERVEACHRFWNGDHYAMSLVFDVKRVNLCHDKFCVNCQHVKQASRLKRFTPVFDELRNTYDLYHLTLTVPNVPGIELNNALNKMFAAFKKLIRYFSDDARIAGVNFKKYGYAGAVRGLEIVTNSFDYHPHFHCAILLAKDLDFVKQHITCFSYDHGILKRKFSDLEILIQKIWYLAYNGKRVDLDNISGVPEGYSCTLDEVEGDDWHEVFKYVTKLTNGGDPALTYEQFKTLYFALRRRRIMQGYGILYNIAENDDDDDEVALEYAKILAKLRALEDPIKNWSYNIDELVTDIRGERITAISKRLVQKWLNELAKKDGDQ